MKKGNEEVLYSFKEIAKSLGGVVVYTLKKNEKEPFHILVFTIVEEDKDEGEGEGEEDEMRVMGEFYKGFRKGNPYLKNYSGGLLGDLVGKKEILRISKDREVKRETLEITLDNIVYGIGEEKIKAETTYKNMMLLGEEEGIPIGAVDGLNVDADVKKEVVEKLRRSLDKLLGYGEYGVIDNLPLYHFKDHD